MGGSNSGGLLHGTRPQASSVASVEKRLPWCHAHWASPPLVSRWGVRRTVRRARTHCTSRRLPTTTARWPVHGTNWASRPWPGSCGGRRWDGWSPAALDRPGERDDAPGPLARPGPAVGPGTCLPRVGRGTRHRLRAAARARDASRPLKPPGPCPEDVLGDHRRRLVEASPLPGDGDRTVWARRRHGDLRPAPRRVWRLRRAHQLVGPDAAGPPAWIASP
jgi:hypothetical protein